MKTIRVDIKVQSERELKVTWNDDSPWLPYLINRKAVEDRGRDIRRILGKLVDAALNDKLQSCCDVMRELAQEGKSLHHLLFDKIGGEQDPERIRSRYETTREPFRLRFIVSDSLFVPWGLIYPSDPDLLPDRWADNAHDACVPYQNFWCLKHELATMYERIPPDAAGEDASGLDMVRVINPDAYGSAAASLAQCPEEDFHNWLKNRFGDPLTTSKALKDLWRNNGSRIGLLYFYCHASATRLALGDNEQIESSRLFELLSNVNRPLGSSGCLVFMNGCSTAVGAPSGDFLMATAKQGLCGFIGTETDVPDIFALRFSLRLLHLLLHQKLSLGAAMRRMYREHFPLSLVYGLYAHPDFRMSRDDAPLFPPDAPNFSMTRVGTNRLEICHDS